MKRKNTKEMNRKRKVKQKRRKMKRTWTIYERNWIKIK
jgi:hypothetical protein